MANSKEKLTAQTNHAQTAEKATWESETDDNFLK
jgi:hypothetical protein